MTTPAVKYSFVIFDKRDVGRRIAESVQSGQPVSLNGMYESGGPQSVTELVLQQVQFLPDRAPYLLPHQMEWGGSKFWGVVRMTGHGRMVGDYVAYGYIDPSKGVGVVDIFNQRA